MYSIIIIYIYIIYIYNIDLLTVKIVGCWFAGWLVASLIHAGTALNPANKMLLYEVTNTIKHAFSISFTLQIFIASQHLVGDPPHPIAFAG